MLDTTRDSNQPVNFYNENEPDIQKRVNLQLSLDQFQTLYTRYSDMLLLSRNTNPSILVRIMHHLQRY